MRPTCNVQSGLALLLTLLTLSSGLAQAAVDRPVLVVGGDYDYPPFEFINEQGQPDGYNVEMTRAIAKVMGLEVRVVLGPWDELPGKLERGEIDAIEGIQKSAQREGYLDFTPPHAIISHSVFARQGGRRGITLADLDGHSVLVQKRGFMQEYLRSQAPAADCVAVATHVEALRLLAAGKYDYAAVAVPIGIYLQKKFHLTNIEPVSAPLTTTPYCYVVKKGNREVLSLLNSGLAILINTGVQQKLSAKWLGDGMEQVSGWSLLLRYGPWVLTPLLLILTGVMVWNSALKRKVNQRTRELADRQRQLVQADKLASLGILTSGVAHEINTPNSIILMNLSIFAEAWEDAWPILDAHYRRHGNFPLAGLSYERLRDELSVMLVDMTDAARRIRQIVNDLKAYARQEEPGVAVELDLNEVVQNAVRLAEVSIRKATAQPVFTYAQDLPRVRGYPQRLTQVAVNLIVNACQALEHPEQGIEITTGLDTASGRVMLQVRDEGCGIRAEDMARLTDPFFTTKRESGGTGLGLSVSLGIVREHGGELTFDAPPGGPTVVSLLLPAMEHTL